MPLLGYLPAKQSARATSGKYIVPTDLIFPRLTTSVLLETFIFYMLRCSAKYSTEIKIKINTVNIVLSW